MAMTTYSGLRGWLRKLHCYDDDLSQDPNEFGRYQTSVGIKCADEPPYRPGDWIEAVFRPHNQAMDDLARLSAEHPELGRQIRDVLDQAEAAYSRFAKASAAEEPSASVMLTAYPANAADLAWWHLQGPISNLQRRLTVALGLLDALTTGPQAGDSDERPGFMSVRQLAEKYGVDRAALDARLRRWRKKSIADSAWIKHDSPRKNEPSFLYREDAVHEEIQALKSVERA